VVEFISAESGPDLEEPPPEPEELQKTLEAMVEEQVEELHAIQSEQEYVDEPSGVSGDYHQPEPSNLNDAPELKHELRPSVYDESIDRPVVVDIFERYSKSDPANDKWWTKKSL